MVTSNMQSAKEPKRYNFHLNDHQMLLQDMSRQDSVRSGLSRDDSTPVLWKRSSRRPSMGMSKGLMGSDRSLLSNAPSQMSLNVKDDNSVFNDRQSSRRLISHQPSTRIFDDVDVMASYASVPLLEIDHLPRGGISFDTQAVGRIQFGIPPETIKDSMVLGLGVPSVYIVPVERFCREMGPALGINLCEFEFPAYFNYFVRVKRCTLVVDSAEDEENIRQVFGETLLGPQVFRNHAKPTPNMDEDFDPCYSVDARPNFYKEFYHFRTAEESTNYEEMTIDHIIEFTHFNSAGPAGLGNGMGKQSALSKLGVPPSILYEEDDENNFYNSVSDIQIQKSSSKRGMIKNSVVHEEVDDESDCGSALRRTASDPDLDNMLRPSKNYNALMSQAREESDPKLKRISQKSSRRFHYDVNDNDSKVTDGFWGSVASVNESEDGDKRKDDWTYSQAKWLGVVATVYRPNATEADKRTTMTARIEIFKMPGGLEYIVHDINDRNEIIGRVRFSGTVHIPDSIAVNGFTNSKNDQDSASSDVNDKDETVISIPRSVTPPTFHPPSFGVTVLGNSHGFDKSGSTSGYVLWINGRGVMIDPPPYSSATLEKEGIRTQMIMAILVTHCHADHDAGAFQKIMAGSRVAVITTPTIYSSFIRKYAALSGLSETLLRHSHRHRPAIIGQPLMFQGASFHFTYTFHTIPCIAFRVEWRGKSIVFTGDHLNSPPIIDRLEQEGVLAKARADSLRYMPLQECDLLLHESGAPPIHTPLKVLLELPENVKRRLYVVHTSALPEGCPLRVAPTGTAGTIRLDRTDQGSCIPRSIGANIDSESIQSNVPFKKENSSSALSLKSLREGYGRVKAGSAKFNLDFKMNEADTPLAKSIRKFAQRLGPGSRQPQDIIKDESSPANTSDTEYYEEEDENKEQGDGSHGKVDTYGWTKRRQSGILARGRCEERCLGGSMSSNNGTPPLVELRPTCVSDAWFILNLLSNVPFLSSLSYDKTMEVLETAIVKYFSADDVIIPADRRSDILCVVWEGTCIERERRDYHHMDNANSGPQTIRHSGFSDQLKTSTTSLYSGSDDDGSENSKDFSPAVWHAGDWTGPAAFQPDNSLTGDPLVSSRILKRDVVAVSPQGVKVILVYMKDLHAILKFGSPLYRKYLANRQLEMTDGSNTYWAYLNDNDLFAQKVTSTLAKQVTFNKSLPGPQRKLLDNLNFLEIINYNSSLRRLTASQKRHLESLVEGPRYFEPDAPIWRVGAHVECAYLIVGGTAQFAGQRQYEKLGRRGSTGSMDVFARGNNTPVPVEVKTPAASMPVKEETSDKLLFNVHPKSEYRRLEVALQLRAEEVEAGSFDNSNEILPKEERLRDSRDRFANKVLARLYTRRAYTAGLVFSRGHFLSDTTRMVSGSLAFIEGREITQSGWVEKHVHSSTMIAGSDGCLVMEFPRVSLTSFLDAYPGVLLSLLGTQIIV